MKRFKAGPNFDNKVVFFGLQAVVKSLLIEDWNKNFFSQPEKDVATAYIRRINNYLGPNTIGTDHVLALHRLGFLPVLIKALPEGSRVNARVPLWTIQNTIPEFFWLSNYLETQLSCESWKMPTSATTAYEFRRMFDHYAKLTGSPMDMVQFQGHDFSMRGMCGIADAASSGAAHLLSFSGTDTLPAIDFLERYYGADSDKEMVGVSVPATEHSVMCMGGMDDEIGTFERLITEVYPSGIVSIVSDTWDFWKVVTEYLPALKDKIMARNGKVVIRPDSGDPVDMLCGTAIPVVNENDLYGKLHEYKNSIFVIKGIYYSVWHSEERGHYLEEIIPLPEDKGLIECLWDAFGGTITATGHKLLDSHIGSIYGDSITLERANEINERLMNKGFASLNWVAGIGSFTYQAVTRDTLGTAMKATYGVVNGESRVLFKAPKTDNGEKNSARGLLRVEKEGDDFVLYENQTVEEEKMGQLQPVFVNGQLLRFQTLAEIRKILHGN